MAELTEIKKRCFVITPVGDVDSDIRKQTNTVIDTILQPILTSTEFNYEVIVPHRVFEMGSITKQIITDIFDSELVISNLTGLNPNVMYETSFRHACGKPIIHICESSTKLPFDIKDQRTIFFQNNLSGAQVLRDSLINSLRNIRELHEDIDNPIYNGLINRKIGRIIYEHSKQEFNENTKYFRTPIYYNRNREDNCIVSEIIICNYSKGYWGSFYLDVYSLVGIVLNIAKKLGIIVIIISYLQYDEEYQCELVINNDDEIDLGTILDEFNMLFSNLGFSNVNCHTKWAK